MQSRYQVKSLPGSLYRVVDTEDERLEGVWNAREKMWFNARGLIDDQREARNA